MQRGYIRFVGGPMHNQHVRCAWDPRQVYHRRMYQSSMTSADPLMAIRVEEYVYLLHRFRSARGALFYEYHLDVEQTADSGEDFMLPLDPDVECLLFGWFFREAVAPYLR